MGEGRLQWGSRAGKRLLRTGKTRLCRGWQKGGGARASRFLLGLLVHAWLWAASGSSAQVFNLSLSVDEGLPPDTLVGDIRAGLPAAQQQDGGGFFLSEDSDDSPLLDAFHVHSDTGIIRTARRLDREQRDHYSFVAATLLGAVVQVEIRVNDVNDHSPRFPQESLQLDVSELSPPGTVFRLPGAHDPDAGLFSTQGYTLVQPAHLPGEPKGPLFQLRYGTLGSASSSPLEPLDLVLLQRLDREAAAKHELQIEAWDGGRPRRTGLLRVQLCVLDENDNPPIFERDEYRAAVREDAPPGAEVCRLRATDRDLGPNGHVRYSVRTRPGSGAGGGSGDAAFFAVDELSGVVRVRRPLDREAQAWHQLVVEARDGGAEPEVATVRVSIAVLDVNDNWPTIHLLFLTEGGAPCVSEGARPGDYVARVSVSDADGDPEKVEDAAAGEPSAGLGSSSVSLSLQGGEGVFALRPGGSSGVFFLCVEGPLDRENRDLFDLRLVATDAGSPPLSTEETVLLRVADLNDQPPVFSLERYRASVSEAAAPGTAVLRVSASDADEAGTEHARLLYSLEQLSPHCTAEASPLTGQCGPYFTIDPDSGVISTALTLDREVQESVELRVMAQDLGEPPLSATCLVSLTVEDVNDNEPVFGRQVYNVTLAEHAPVGHCFLQVKASDEDAGLYGLVEYELYNGFQSQEAPHAFRIDPVDGQICVAQDMDRERDPATYDLLVRAKDGGGLSAQAFVRVELEDVNDNRPVFNPATYVTSISRQTPPGTEIINVLATDRDAGCFGTVAYALLPGELSSLFTIDSATGIIYSASMLSHLESATLLLIVSAQDGGGLTADTNAHVTVHLLQTMLAPAEFERPKYTFSVYEDVPINSLVGTVKAREHLNSSEPNEYRISSGDLDETFSIHPWLGTIHTRKPLDHETQPVVVLTVQAQLAGSSAYSNTEVNITIIDVNDNHPTFLTASDEIKISQSTAPGTALYLARAEDKDSGLNGFIRYSIASPNPSFFAIHRELGVVHLSASLAGDGLRNYTLTLRAQDLGAPPRASLLVLTVVVEPQDQSRPLAFQNLIYQVEVSESLSVMTQLLQIQAFPCDPQATASQPAYSLEPGLSSAVFGIHPYTGWIYLRRQLDYESIQTYSFRAFAWIPEDRLSQNVSTSVVVHVLDANDNPPAFLHGVLFLKVEESPVPQGVLGKITAVDADSGRNGQLSYFLLSDGKFFKMNPNTGELMSWLALDRELQRHHRVTVLVTDHGSPPRNATTTVHITVSDVNDNRPFFPQCLPGGELHIKVLEGQPVNMLVTTVFAKDLDEGNNAEVTYSVLSGDDSDHFKIDANSGEIRTTRMLSCASRPSFKLIVVASDQGVPPLQGQAIINIQVIPLSKGSAIISQVIRHLVIPENWKPAKILSLIKSPDHLQQHRHGELHFSIVADDKEGPFEIDSTTGDVFLAKELDYEMTSHYLFRVITKDYSQDPAPNSTIFFSIDVEDQNDHSPSFQDDFIVISVEENVPVGTLVHVFNAKDGDGSFLNSRIQYSIESHHPGVNPFLIHPSFGTLVTASALDRESVAAVSLTVTASDQAVNVTDRRVASLTARVVILDVNDHSPTITSLPIVQIREDVVVGSWVHWITAKDPDEGRNGQVTYSILSGNENLAFMLDKSSGFLSTACSLDYETQSQHLLTVLALDHGAPALSSTQTLTVNVVDVNDEAPVFKQRIYEAFVKENQNPGEFVTRVEAVDGDSGVNSKLQFEIMPGASSDLFEINPDTGEIVTTTMFDREVQEIFTLRVLARDGGVPSLSGTTTVLCIIEDVNDHAPEFITASHDIEIPENREPEIIYTVWASDRDAGNNGAVTYHIIGGNTDEYFAIHETSGELSTTHALDREQVSSFTLVLLASDLGVPPRSSILQVHIRVLDDNDHSPAFPILHYQASVAEDAQVGTPVLVLSAVDEDEGLNGHIEYFLMDAASGTFTIDHTTGTLRTGRTLDREARSEHTFRAVARDRGMQGSRSTTITVTVHVMDVNDNNPVWGQNPSDVLLSSWSLPNQKVAILRASDLDLGPNGTVMFCFAETQSAFSIDQHTGEIKLQQNLSQENFPMWLPLRVTDQGVPARATTGLLVVHMEGEDVRISFSDPLYEGFVMEDCEAGTSIVTVKALAADSIQDSIEYSIFSGNEDKTFSLDSQSGQLTVRNPRFLDFEVRNEVQLIIVAESSGQRAYSKVKILIQDVNDNVPYFGQSVYQASVSEGQSRKAHVIQVFATDPDSGLNGLLEYSVIAGNHGEVFWIDAQSGVITTNAVLDYEASSSYSLVVQAKDGGTPSLSATTVVNIQVIDLNDNAPFFLPPKAVEIAENSLPGTIVSRVSVHDVDLNPAFIFNFIKESDPGNKFTIDQNTGEVLLVKNLDFEEANEYKLLIQISDWVHITECVLTVQVLDINDNPPVFSQDFYQVTIPESVPVGYSVLTVSATDIESKDNISYRMISSSKHFSIDLKNGTVFITNPILLLDEISTVQFLVEASDEGIPNLRTLALVEVEIRDVNDHAPEFTVECYNQSLSEDTAIGSVVLTFSTLDQDWTRENTYVEYSILSGDSQNNFYVGTSFTDSEHPSQQAGYLTLLHSLDREVAASHQLVILASDRGFPPLSSTAVVSIEVLDVNDNPPEFSSLQYHAHVKESTPPGSSITVVSAGDRDTGLRAQIIYTIISGNEKGQFRLEKNTGILYLMKPLDYEDRIRFTLTVQAANEEMEHFSFASVFVSVLDDNDHAPQFLFSSLNCAVPENLPVFSTLCSVNALDLDAGPYGELTYSMSSPCHVPPGLPSGFDLFRIDSLTGEIHAKQALDYENGSKYCLMVEAKDKGDATASMMVWVDIEGIDEFEPVFTQDQYFFHLPENNEVSPLIGRVEASDADAGLDGVVLYSLGTSSPFFSVNATTGHIYLVRSVSLVQSQVSKDTMFEVKILAHSPKVDSRTAMCTVFVNMSLLQEGQHSVATHSSFFVSLAVSVLVFLLLVCILLMLILRHKQKHTVDDYKKKTSLPLDASLRPSVDASAFKTFQEDHECRVEVVPVDHTPEWLSLLSVMEKDLATLYRHSNSSGHCSVEGETAEDKEIQRINEHPYRKDLDSALSDRESRVPDSGIPRDSDQLSCLSVETDVTVTAEAADVSSMVEGRDRGANHNTTCTPKNGSPQALQKGETKKDILVDVAGDYLSVPGDGAAAGSALPTLRTADPEGRSSYPWDCLLSWEPKFQSLSSVFYDIAKLKDEHSQRPGMSKGNSSGVFPPPLITAIAQPGIKAVPPRMPAAPPGHVLQRHPRSPVLYHLASITKAMTPSFSPSLSMLTLQNPAMSPLLSDGDILGLHVNGTHPELKAEDEVQI